MPKLKDETIEVEAGIGTGIRNSFKVSVYVNSSGEFYSPIPEELLGYFEYGGDYQDARCWKNKNGALTLYSKQHRSLIKALEKAAYAVNKPEVIVEHVILYNIESHVSFAVAGDGKIYPNSGYTDDCQWPVDDERMYGNHHAGNRSKGGYRLCIGAQACEKTTTKLGDKESVEYRNYYGEGGRNLGKETPAEKLNSWTGFVLPDNAREIPYSDEAALFFHKMMYGIAELCKKVQEATFDKQNLLHLIEKEFPLLDFKEKPNN